MQACLDYAELEQNARSEKLFQIASYSNLTKEEKRMYDTSLKRKWDNQNALNYARKEGEHRKAVETAIAMKKDGLSIEAIRKYTGLSKEEIEKL
ncbi:MAG: hypothetical protein AB2L20_17775 [Mangrovibacterium sp.]